MFFFVMFVQDGLAPMGSVRWRPCPAKFSKGMCEMKILGFEISWCIFRALVQDGLAPVCGVTWKAVALKCKTIKTVMGEMKSSHRKCCCVSGRLFTMGRHECVV